jgi:hypothetical protein
MAQRAEEGGVGGSGRGAGRGWGGGALLTGAAPRLRAAQPPPSPPRGGRLHLRPSPSPSQDGDTALDEAKKQNRTEVIKLLEKYTPAYFAAQVGRAAPHPATPSHRPCAVCDRCVEPHPWL